MNRSTLPRMVRRLMVGALACALFVLLAVVMWVTRKVDWYARDGE